jgi:hypothetical protein
MRGAGNRKATVQTNCCRWAYAGFCDLLLMYVDENDALYREN